MTAGPCVYCRREMDRSGSKTSLERTADHVMPIWMRREKLYELTWTELQTILPCCWHCNQLKGDMSPGQWAAFMKANPHWWEMPEHRRTRGDGPRKRKPMKSRRFARDRIASVLDTKLRKALKNDPTNPELLALEGSRGDTLEDSEILELLTGYQQTGKVLHERQ